MQASVVTGETYVSADLGTQLAEIGVPASFLDFETLSPAVPIFPGTRPYQAIPFQWSLHVRAFDGSLVHKYFLDDGVGDPRKRFMESLLESVPPVGPVVTYSSYEVTVLKRLAEEMAPYRSLLLELRGRIVDLLPIVRSSYYHAKFRGSFSIKSVASALVPALDYNDLEIQDGTSAAAKYEQLVREKVDEPEAAQIREALLAYCSRDTEAMVHVYEALLTEANT